jgi:NCS1 family nucleobase:cation symporter-1
MADSMGGKVPNVSILNMYSWNYVLIVVFSGVLYWALEAIWPVTVRPDDSDDSGELYLIEGFEPHGGMVAEVVEQGRGKVGSESEKKGRGMPSSSMM